MIVGRELTFDRVFADLGKLLGFPAVAAKEGNVQAELFGLDRDESGVGVVAGNKNTIRTGGLDGGELRLEILVATVEIEFRADLAAAILDELLRQNFARPLL